jgi:membrane fusion protein (multidrug efflux system)
MYFMHPRIMNRAHLLFAALVLSLVSACSKNSSTTQVETFQVIKLAEKTVDYNNEFVAEILAAQRVEVRNRVKGYIERVLVDEGQSVRAGQKLFIISNKFYRHELEQAEANTKSVYADLKAAKIELANGKTLFDKNVISKPEVELLEAKADALQAKYEEAQAAEQQARLNLSFSDIEAPFNGVINRLPHKTGSLVEEGTMLTTISNSGSIFAYFNVSEKDYLDYARAKREGKPKTVSLKLADGSLYPHTGTIETTENEFDKSTGNIAFRARFPNPDNLLKHGSSGKIIVKTELKNAMLIPQKSTIEVQENIYVFAVDKNNKVQMRRVVPAFRLPQFYAISAGLSADDTFIYEGVQRVKDGATIIPQPTPFPQLGESNNN